MTYSRQISEALKKAGARVGDRIRAKDYEGVLMPSPELVKDSQHIMLKLDTGYNIGIKFEPKLEIKKISGKKEVKTKARTRAKPQSKRRIALLATGGTISSKVDYTTGGVNAALTPPGV